jgi:hypothetical protein
VSSRSAAEVQALVEKGDFAMALVPENADDPTQATERWLGTVGPWFDVLAGAARRASGRDEKRQLYIELQRIWSEALPGLPIYQRLRVDIASRSLTGIQPPAHDDALTWNAGEWRFIPP